ncbi:MAG: hypothetical protein WD607_07230 [Candidatus Paceibacterota bacterium]
MKYLLSGQETDRLRFRLLTRDDFHTWMDLFNDDSVGRFLGMADLATPSIGHPDADQDLVFRVPQRTYLRSHIIQNMHSYFPKYRHPYFPKNTHIYFPVTDKGSLDMFL